MKIIVSFIVILLANLVSAQTVVQKFANKAGDLIAYTYEVVDAENSGQVYADDQPVSNERVAIKYFYNEFAAIEGVQEVVYDNATTLFSITATPAAIMPEKIIIPNKEN